MTQPGMPNTIELYEGAVEYMRPIIAGVKPEQLGSATPCSEWNVQQLINHNIKVAQSAHNTLIGGEILNPFDVDVPLPPEGAAEAFLTATARVLEAIKAPGAADKIIDTPFGQLPASQFLMMPFGDVLIHKWDLAKATGQNTDMDSSMADVCYKMVEPMVEGGRQGGFFGPAVVVPVNASDRDKLLGLTGRIP